MTEEKGSLPDVQGLEDEVDEMSGEVVVIRSPEELLSFLMDVLDFGEGVESEEMLENNSSYRILSALLKKIPVFTAAIEHKYVDRIYRDSYYMHFSCKHAKYDRFCKRLFLFEGDVFEGTAEKLLDVDVQELQKRLVGTVR